MGVWDFCASEEGDIFVEGLPRRFIGSRHYFKCFGFERATWRIEVEYLDGEGATEKKIVNGETDVVELRVMWWPWK